MSHNVPILNLAYCFNQTLSPPPDASTTSSNEYVRYRYEKRLHLHAKGPNQNHCSPPVPIPLNLSYYLHLPEDSIGKIGIGRVSTHVFGPNLSISNDPVYSL